MQVKNQKIWRYRTIVVTAICGEMGSGKTLTMSFILYRNYFKKKIPIYANYGFKFRDKFLKNSAMMKECKDGVLALDEVWLWIDSRSFMNKKNKFLTTVLMRSRRRGLDIIYTAQDFSQVDKRLRNVTDIIMYPELSIKKYKCYVRSYMVGSGKELPIFYYKTKGVFKIYDHKEDLEYLDEDDQSEILAEREFKKHS